MEDGDEGFVCKVMRDILVRCMGGPFMGWCNVDSLLSEFTCALLEITVYSPPILYIILTCYLVHFWNSYFMYRICTWCVVFMSVAWSAYSKNYTYFVYTLHIRYLLAYFGTKDLSRIWTHNFRNTITLYIVLITITLRHLEHAL